MLTPQERTALANSGDPASWPIVAKLVADAMAGNSEGLTLIGTGPGLCVQVLIPTGDGSEDPSLVVLVDRTHHRPAIVVMDDKEQAAKEVSEIIAFAWKMHGSGRLPELVEEGLTRWREGELVEGMASSERETRNADSRV
jgi:hypothetical protein